VFDSEFLKNARDVVAPVPFDRFEGNKFGGSIVR
jgi:hypothetical protein